MKSLYACMVFFAVASQVSAQINLRAPLNKGTYRIAGKCISLTMVGIDVTQHCVDLLGVLVQDPAAPMFMFKDSDGTGWLFQTKRAKSIAADGKSAIYELVMFHEVGRQQSWKVNGECRLDLRDGIRVECRGKYGRKPGRSGVFESHGTFEFQRE